MLLRCPKCQLSNSQLSRSNHSIRKDGFFYRTSDRKRVQRYHCSQCNKYFSAATLHDCYFQKKRHLNSSVARHLVAGVSLRETARVIKINKKTVSRKMSFMAKRAKVAIPKLNASYPRADKIQFDDMETFVHSKFKPISISMAVETGSRRILGFELAEMPAKGHLVKKALKKYGKRQDQRSESRKRLFTALIPLVTPTVEIKSDDNPHYPKDVEAYFPLGAHIRVKGGRSSLTGQGELKKQKFDPIFSFNHTAAMVRYRLSRMIRKTWCTSKKIEGIEEHLLLMVAHHNHQIWLKNPQAEGSVLE